MSPPIKTPAQHLVTLRILWFSFIVAHLLFVGLVFSGKLSAPPTANTLTAEDATRLRYLLGALAIVCVLAAPVVRYMMYFKPKAAGELSVEGRMVSSTRAALTAFALAESATLFGFVIAFLTVTPHLNHPLRRHRAAVPPDLDAKTGSPRRLSAAARLHLIAALQAKGRRLTRCQP